MGREVCVVVPIYKDRFDKFEEISLRQCYKVLGNHILVAIKPQSIDISFSKDILDFDIIINFDDNYFKGIKGYNSLMMSSEFYSQFLDYKYILIYQLDCFVFKDELISWCRLDYDYIGAPWITSLYKKNRFQLWAKKIKDAFDLKKYWQDDRYPNEYQFKNKVGNGGFSLRNVKVFYQLADMMKPIISDFLLRDNNVYNEDVFWSIEVNREINILKIPSVEVAKKFAFETPPVKQQDLTDENLPFGCHDWDFHLNYWRPIFRKYGIEI